MQRIWKGWEIVGTKKARSESESASKASLREYAVLTPSTASGPPPSKMEAWSMASLPLRR